ncbi:GMP reductase [Campylobacter canadensis]|uniref:GMP reductase n=1 Tax=Campylobacter canadensis TaxID=449520 RepID=A0ABS7WTL0_9BACT|nr:GMP reductase [Campylobacter canadensis]MBZ7987290.1 GMP reductase [Campylobacter canadensis]MBZ7994368.1 GMP reductase [Campylobacter canadensis]MBZ7996065.1 GMP reductase [Campylobacter canadensis]MBZ7998281.1 GMP reductase [Campylobacter canadensis]MBZ7999701.1 GMP reductase [Campylobacter canadensis]
MLNNLLVFDYEDVQLIPAKCIVNSRAECDTSVCLGKRKFKLPVVPANMQTIIDEKLAKELASKDYFYIMHRFNPDSRKNFIADMKNSNLFSSISVGVKEDEYEFILELSKEKLLPDYITIDIAHGHSDNVIKMIKHIKKHLKNSFVIAGNVGTPNAVRDLENAGADATKVGIGPGKVCITKLKTGFGTGGWQLAALRWCAKSAKKPIIADGGIRNHGDVAKSIRFGASFVMIGSLFSGHSQSPGECIEVDGKLMKEYYGSASEFQKGEKKNVEGKKMYVPFRGDIFETLSHMQQDLQSSISYAGGNKLSDICKVDYVVVKNSIFNGDSI